MKEKLISFIIEMEALLNENKDIVDFVSNTFVPQIELSDYGLAIADLMKIVHKNHARMEEIISDIMKSCK